MKRRRLTELFPWLIPLRRRQRKLFFYLGMKLDHNRYAAQRSEDLLPTEIFSSSCPM